MIIFKILATIFMFISVVFYYGSHIMDPNFQSKAYETFVYILLAIITLITVWK